LSPTDAGNQAFMEGKYEEAVAHYSNAITQDEKNHKLISNRSAAYCELNNIDSVT